jgi:hypothetical protein
MLASQMPAELAVNTTGHDLTASSAFYRYLDAKRPLCMAGARVLSGHPAPPFGQNGMGPRPASLTALEALGVDLQRLDSLINSIFGIDSASPR